MFSAELDKNKEYSLFLKALLVVFIIRLSISIWLPISGDEAYFVIWGKNFDYGFYDHTPFVGWLLTAFLTISDAVWWLRLPSTLLPIFLSFAIYSILKKQQSKVALWVALTFLAAPVNIINVLITTDTPLIFFSFVSVWYFYRAVTTLNNNTYHLFALAGFFLGLSFLSKYFAVFLGFTFAVYIFMFHRNKKDITGLAIILLMVSPFVLMNIWWNYNNCWSNILFNLYNRASSEENILSNLLKYMAVLVYLFSPVFIYYLIKNRKEIRKKEPKQYQRVYYWMIVIPLILFSILLLRKTIGLHWVLSFYPFAFVAAATWLNTKEWRYTFYFMAGFSGIHLLIIIAVLTLPINVFTTNKFSIQDYAFGMYPDKFLKKLKPYEKVYTFAMVSYGMASVASYHSNKHFIIFSEGSVHARTDDKLTNYKKLNGKNILLVKRTKENLKMHERYFQSTKIKFMQVDGVRFELMLGQGFKYKLYREEILSKINTSYYNIPDWLPIGQCDFKKKYDFD